MRLFHTLLITICLLGSTGMPLLAKATTYTSALNAYERGNHHLALHGFRELAHQNHQHAQYMLGKMYAIGQGTAKDNVLAYKWLYLASESGVQSAANLMRTVNRRLSHHEKKWAEKLVRDYRNHYANSYEQPEYSHQETVIRVQRQLSELGYYNHKIDGVLGGKTRKAIRKYQKDKLMRVDGRITQPLVESLYLKTKNSGPKAYSGYGHSQYQDNNAVLVKKLERLIRKGRKQQAAAPWFLKRLETIAWQIEQ